MGQGSSIFLTGFIAEMWEKIPVFTAIIIGLIAFTVIFMILHTIIWPTMDKQTRLNRYIEHNKKMDELRARGFSPEKLYKKPMTEEGKVGKIQYEYNYLVFDFSHYLCAFEYQVFPLRSVVTVQLINDSTVVQSAGMRQDGFAFAGMGIPAVGSFSGQAQMQSGEKSAVIAVRVILDSMKLPSVLIPFLFGEVADKASVPYQNAATAAYEVYGIFESVVRNNQQRAPR